MQGHGGETEHVETYRGTTVKMELVEKVRLDIGVSDPFVDVTIDAILARGPHRRGRRRQDLRRCRSRRCIRIRTGEEDQAAVTPALPEVAAK